MSSLNYVEKEKMANLFGIKNGYVFSYLRNYNKTKTRNLILDATGIDIYSDPEFSMSQERCIRKIWDEYDDHTVGKLLKVMLDYYISVADWSVSGAEERNYIELRELQEKLMKTSVIIPETDDVTLDMMKADIEQNCNNNTPELALDRLHTFSTLFFRKLCVKHNLSISNENGDYYPLHSLVGSLRRWYEANNYFDSDFSIKAIRYSISIFTAYNTIRNEQSAAHPNSLLNKAEATYVVRIICETLSFIDTIEKSKDAESNHQYPWEMDGEMVVDDDELPF